MKTLIQIRALLGMLALAALVPAALNAQDADSLLSQSDSDTLAAQLDNSDSLLAQAQSMDLAVLDRISAVREEAGSRQILVDIALEPKASLADSARSLLSESGLNLEVISGSDPDRLRAWISADELSLAQDLLQTVSSDVEMRAYRQPVANFGAIESEGTGAMLADLYHAAGAQGEGVKIALFDIGYRGLTTSFDETGIDADSAGIRNTDSDASAHGTAMLEVIRDVAPQAKIVPYRIGVDLDIYSATQQALLEGAEIIVCPLSWFELPGEGAACDAARLAVDNGVMWVNAAGNFSNGSYWEADQPLWTSYNRNTYLSFMNGGLDPMNEITGVVAGESFNVHMSYELVPGSQLQLSLELHAFDGVNMEIVATDTAGLQEQSVSAIADGRQYFALVRVDYADVMGRIRMFLPDSTGSFSYSNAEGAVANPATVPGVISVGAMPASSYGLGGLLEAESSRGGGVWNLDIDMVGPSQVTTATYGPIPFSGTSASSAAIGGLLALQLGDSGLAKDPLGNLQYFDIGGDGIDFETGSGAVFALVDPSEPDNSLDEATDLGSSSVLVAGRMISPSSDMDYYRIELASPKSIRVNIDAELQIDLIAQDGSVDGDITGTGSAYKALAQAGIHYIRVSGSNGGIVPSYVMNVEIFDGPPSEVKLLSPVNGEVVEPGASLRWTASQSSLPVAYYVEIARNVEFTKKSTIFSATSESMTLPADYVDGQVFWRVTAVNSAGDTSKTSEIGEFEVNGLTGGIVSDLPATDLGSQLIGAEGLVESSSVSDQDSAGCTSGSNRGLVFLMIAILGSVIGIRIHHKRKAQEVEA